MTLRRIASILLGAASVSTLALAQTNNSGNEAKPPSENGAIQAYLDSGWSFGMPAVHAFVQVGPTIASSPVKKTLLAPSFGVTVTAWRFLVPFFDLTAYDTGSATASIGQFTSSVKTGNTLTAVGGLRFVAGRDRLRGYVETGGGEFYNSATAALSYGGTTQTANLKGSTGAVVFGGGVQAFVGRHWGSDIGFDVFHLARALAVGGSNFSRVRFGVFFQTKSRVR